MASFLVDKGANEGQTIPLTNDKVVIGRDPDCHIVIPVNAVSRKHAVVVRDARDFAIEDLKSRNHTYLNDRMIEPGIKVKLKDGDKVRICDFEATFVDPTAAS